MLSIEIFWASSTIIIVLSILLPLTKAKGCILIRPNSLNLRVNDSPIIFSKLSTKEPMYGSNFSCISPGKWPNSSPFNCTTDLTKSIFLYLGLDFIILSASAQAI